MSLLGGKNQNRQEAAAFLLYGIMILALTRLSWMRWGDLIIDTGKEWHVPAELLSGRLLYRDIAWPYGPLVPYLNALFLRLGGVHVVTLVASGIFSLLLAVYALHRLARKALDLLPAFLVVSTFILVCAFGNYAPLGNYNFMIPYSYASTYGMAFALLGLYFFQMKADNPDRIAGALPVTFITAALLTRVEIGVMLLLAIGASSLAAFAADRQQGRPKILSMLMMAASSVGITALVYAVLFGMLIRENTGTWDGFVAHLSPQGTFFRSLAGLDHLGENLSVLTASCACYALFTVLFAAGGWLDGSARNFRSGLGAGFLRAASALLILAVTTLIFYNFFRIKSQFQCLPLLCLLTAANAARNLWRGYNQGRELGILTVSLFSFMALSRMLLQVWPAHYGFYLLVPGLLVYYFFFLRLLPSFFSGESTRLFVKGGFVFLSLLFILVNVKTEAAGYARRTLPVPSPRGTLSFFPAEPFLGCKSFIEYLQKNTAPGESLVVFPEGVGINFLTGLKNPLNDYAYTPIDLAPEGASARVLRQLESHKVAYVAVLQRDTTEYGLSSFGRDYALDIMEYVAKNYELHQQFGPIPYTTSQFGIALFKRKVF